MQKADHHIGNLHAGVVDVILYIDLLARGAQQAHKGVAEDGIAQMADVRGLVGVDGGVLNQCMERTFGGVASPGGPPSELLRRDRGGR